MTWKYASIWPAIGLAAAGLTACGDSGGATTADPCVTVTYDGVEYCVVAQPIIETGFQCPPHMSFAFNGPGFAVCGPGVSLGVGDAGVIGALGGQGCYAPALDVVVVVDDSSSMSRSQRALVAGLGRFAHQLRMVGARVHFAVTTPDLQCDPATAPIASGGHFSVAPAEVYPPSAQLSESVSCTTDTDCVAALGGAAGDWHCRTPNTESCLVNPNGSVNSSCLMKCTTDTICQDRTGEPTTICQKPSANPADWGCLLPPPAATCPPEVASGVRSWLETNELDQAACVASVGINAERCFRYEQGLGAAWAALDPIGPNPIQSQDFLRPDADLVLIFVSDEDDCTVAAGQTLTEDQYGTCATLGDTTTGGPLVPVAEIADRFQYLKGPDRRVLVAAISGDSLATGPAARQAARDAYFSSKTGPKVCYELTSICTGPLGKADYGARYFALAEAFGDDGVSANVCAPDPFGDLLSRLMARITAPGPSCQPLP